MTTQYIEPYLLSDDRYTIVADNMKELDIKTIDTTVTNEELQAIHSLGFVPVSYKGVIMNTERGPVVVMSDTTYNDGVYILRHDEATYFLDVLVVNTIDKSSLITKTIQDLNQAIATVDVSDLNVYDLTQVYAYTIANRIIKPLARHCYPDNELNQSKFVDLYLPRFLANVARYYIGDSNLYEESVNSEPHIVKLMIDANNIKPEGGDEEDGK